MDLTNEDVADVLALLDSLPYDELDLQTTRFRLTLRRTPDGWTQSTQVLSEPHPLEPAPPPMHITSPMEHRAGYSRLSGTSSRLDEPADGAEEIREAEEAGGEPGGGPGGRPGGEPGGRPGGEPGGGLDGGSGEKPGGGPGTAGLELVAVRAPLPGTFYRAPRPGAEPFVEVGSRVSADTVIGIVETMKLMNSVPAGVGGTVAEICLGNAEFAPHGATLVRIRADQ
jgi:biotin carboxyl carrier protein